MPLLIRLGNESILLGKNVKITVLKIERNPARTGVFAPSGMSVHHSEVDERTSNALNSQSPALDAGVDVESGSSRTD